MLGNLVSLVFLNCQKYFKVLSAYSYNMMLQAVEALVVCVVLVVITVAVVIAL